MSRRPPPPPPVGDQGWVEVVVRSVAGLCVGYLQKIWEVGAPVGKIAVKAGKRSILSLSPSLPVVQVVNWRDVGRRYEAAIGQ